MNLHKTLWLSLFGLIFGTMLFVKILGSTSIPIDVEKNGYCKQFGDNWENRFGENICYNVKKYNEPKIKFTDEEFREHCPKHKFLSLKFNSDCFYESGSIV